MIGQQDRIVDPAYETGIPVLILYEDGWEKQTNISRADLRNIIATGRLVGSTIQIAEVKFIHTRP